jgi:prolyl 4-hydroxylase
MAHRVIQQPDDALCSVMMKRNNQTRRRRFQSVLILRILYPLLQKNVLILMLATSKINAEKSSVDSPTYGVDVSFPIHHASVSQNYPWLPHNANPSKFPMPSNVSDSPLQVLGDRKSWYDRLIKGCRDKYGVRGESCDATEADRIAMNLRQPSSMQNYTDMGFKKIKCPERVYKLLKEFWDKNKHKKKPENWNPGNTYVNHWEAMTYMVSVEDSSLRGGGSHLKNEIWNAARDTIQEWTGEELTQCSLYGIRIYENGAVLAPHVDRLPLVSSAIVNVDQDVDEP